MDTIRQAKEIVCRCEEIEDAARGIATRIRNTRKELTGRDLLNYNALASDCITWLNRVKLALDSYNAEEAEMHLTHAKRSIY